jgi:hypothetical protein
MARQVGPGNMFSDLNRRGADRRRRVWEETP